MYLDETLPLGMTVARSLLSPLSHLLRPEESQIDKDHGIAEFRQLQRPGKAVDRRRLRGWTNRHARPKAISHSGVVLGSHALSDVGPHRHADPQSRAHASSHCRSESTAGSHCYPSVRSHTGTWTTGHRIQYSRKAPSI